MQLKWFDKMGLKRSKLQKALCSGVLGIMLKTEDNVDSLILCALTVWPYDK